MKVLKTMIMCVKEEKEYFKKSFIKSLSFMLMCFLIGFFSVPVTATTNQYVHDLKMYEKRECKYKKKSDINICKQDGIFNSNWTDIVDDELAKLPLKMLKEFKKEGWTITLTSNDVATTYCVNGEKKNTVQGVTLQNEKHIYIQLNDAAVKNAPIHEMGHWLDKHSLSEKKDFKDIYDKENEVFRMYFYDDKSISEMFAEAVYAYYDDPKGLEYACPKTYEYMKHLINKWK